MVSRRTLFVITMMMAVLFFLFIFSGVMKESLNDYEINQYAEEPVLSKTSQWKYGQSDSSNIVLVGSKKDSGIYNVASQWSIYNKRKFEAYNTVDLYKLSDDNLPKLILIDSEGINFDKDLAVIEKWIGKGINIVFCNLPEPEVIKKNDKLSAFLGIQNVYEDSAEIEGVELFGGFLLGGDTFYIAEDDEEDKLQDFELNIPWYQTTSGTKTYIVGLMDKSKVENEYMPSILWRNSVGEAKVFAVNGDFMSELTGLGFLSGIVSECSEYYLYPVVNAQNMSIVNFPSFSEENNDKMMEIYSRSQPAVFKEIVWPNLLATVEKNRSKITCFLSPQYDYEDANEPIDTELIFYLKLIREQNSEAGLSVARKNSIDVKDKLARDRQYFITQTNQYKFSSFYAQRDDIERTVKLAGSIDAEDMTTITTDYHNNGIVLSYAGDNVTLQMSTIDGFDHTYRQDMRVKALETALGYSNIMIDMHRVSWPKNEEDYFEKLSEKFSKYTNTFWQPFKKFEQTTLSESDKRVRNFLVMDFDESRNEDTISIDVKNIEETAWFILRTHGEAVKDITGGNFTELEKDIYLIKADASHVEIELKDTYNEIYYYIGKDEDTDIVENNETESTEESVSDSEDNSQK